MQVTRRSFTKSAASVLLLPSWIFAPRKIRHIDLSLFCDPEYRRYDLKKPFWQEGVTCATDARICVRTTLIAAPPDDSEETRKPKVSELPWWDHDKLTGYRSLECAVERVGITTGYRHECPVCFWKGRVGPGVVECEQCAGSGVEILFEDEGDIDGYERDCRRCKTGWVGGSLCAECNGSGKVDYEYRVADDIHIAPAYFSKLLTLGEVQFATVSESEPLRCVFDGGDALLMPLVLG